MPPRRVPSFDLGVPTPTATQDSDGGGNGASRIEQILKREQAKKKKQIEKQQRAVVDQASQASRKYRDAVQEVIRDGELEMIKVIKQHQLTDKKLKAELAQTEKELLELLQVDCSDTKLAAASIMSSIEEHEQARAAVLEAIETVRQDQETVGQAGLEDLWLTDEEYDEGDQAQQNVGGHGGRRGSG